MARNDDRSTNVFDGVHTHTHTRLLLQHTQHALSLIKEAQTACLMQYPRIWLPRNFKEALSAAYCLMHDMLV